MARGLVPNTGQGWTGITAREKRAAAGRLPAGADAVDRAHNGAAVAEAARLSARRRLRPEDLLLLGRLRQALERPDPVTGWPDPLVLAKLRPPRHSSRPG